LEAQLRSKPHRLVLVSWQVSLVAEDLGPADPRVQASWSHGDHMSWLALLGASQRFGNPACGRACFLVDFLAIGNWERFKLEAKSSSARTMRRAVKQFVYPAHELTVSAGNSSLPEKVNNSQNMVCWILPCPLCHE